MKLVLANGEGFPVRWKWWCLRCGESAITSWNAEGVKHGGCGGSITTKPVYK